MNYIQFKEKYWNHENLNRILLILFGVITLFIAYKHELWRDEAQNWLLNRDLSFIQLWKQLKIEGHPFVWLYFLRIFVLIGIPYKYSYLIPWSLSLITAYLILWKMPYPTYIKIMILCTTPFIYISPAYVRNYCMVVLLSMALAFLYKDRLKHPYIYGILILLLLNTHLITCGIPLSLMFISFIDIFKKENKKPASIILGIGIFGLLLLLFQLMGSSSYVKVDISIKSIIDKIFVISKCIVVNQKLINIYIILLIIPIICFLWKKEWNMTIMYLASIGSVISILLFTHTAYYLCYMIIPGIIFSFWNLKNNTKLIKILLVIIMIFPIIGAIYYVNIDYNRIYSDGYAAANYIKNNIPKGSIISCKNIPQCSAIIPYLEKDSYIFLDAVNQEPFTYVDWKKFYVEERVKHRYEVNTEYGIIVDDKELINYDGYEIIYKTNNNPIDKYKILKKNT